MKVFSSKLRLYIYRHPTIWPYLIQRRISMKTIHKLLLLVIFTFLYSGYSQNPLYAQPIIVNDQPTKQSEEEQRPLPPLGLACSGQGGGLQIDPDNPTCCVSGYVYLNGVPARDATVTIEAIDKEKGIINIRSVTTPVDPPNYLLHVGLDSLAISDVQTVTVAVDSYTVIEQEGKTHTEIDSLGLFKNAVSESDEELIYRIPLIKLGDLDIHTDETVTIVTTYTVSSDTVEETRQYTTSIQIPEPSFNMPLHTSPLDVEPGDLVTMTVTLDGVQKTQSFIAHSGAIQVDMIMPDTRINSSWLSHYLSPREDYAIAYDATNEQMVLFGGLDATGKNLNDTWIQKWNQDGTQQWVQVPVAVNPPARSGHTLLYHDRYDVVLLFGGQNDTGYLNDLWAWNGTKWRELFIDTPVPAPRSHHSIAYDAKRHEVVLFGGIHHGEDGPETTLQDTWILYGTTPNSSTWLQFNLNSSPPQRQRHAMAYNGIDETVVLFGGRSDSSTDTGLLNDTWAWDGTKWQQKASIGEGPVARENHTLTFNDAAQTLYLSGGNNNSAASLDDFWVWNGSSWSETDGSEADRAEIDETQAATVLQSSTIPQLPDFTDREGAALAHEQGSQYLIFGGLANDTPQAQTYRLQFNTPEFSSWQELNPQHQPPARYHHALASGNSPTVLLFGGINSRGDYLNDTWLWNGQDWVQQTATQNPPPRIHPALTYDRARDEWLLLGGVDPAGNTLADFWAYTGTGWEDRTSLLPSGLQARQGATLVYATDRQEALLFGGQDGDTYFNDLWRWNGSTWQIQTFDGDVPTARANHGAAYDETTKQMVIAGGENSRDRVSNTWSWDGQSWMIHYANFELPFNLIASLEYDIENKQMIGIGKGNDSDQNSMILIYQLREEPISTISYLTPKDLYQHEILYLGGRGATTDESRSIALYQWTLDGEPISDSQAEFTMSAESLSPGFHTIRYAVQDDDGDWSEQQVEEIFVRESLRFYLPTVMR